MNPGTVLHRQEMSDLESAGRMAWPLRKPPRCGTGDHHSRTGKGLVPIAAEVGVGIADQQALVAPVWDRQRPTLNARQIGMGAQ